MMEASLATKKLLIRMNSAADQNEVRDLLSQITGNEIDESTAIFTPLYINYSKHTKIGKNVFINFDYIFSSCWGGSY